MITRELIERFFSNECTIEEQEQVMDFFREHPSEFEQYLDENEWTHFQFSEQIDPRLSKKLLKEINSKTIRKKGRVKRITRFAVAASIVLLVGLGWVLLRSKEDKGLSENRSAVPAEQMAFKEVANTTSEKMSVSLPDGSVVELEPNSKIRYADPFVVNNRRDVFLNGAASFRVAKDKTKPFTVGADGIATTALGTFFSVIAFDSSATITVLLKEGKVVVKSADSVVKKFKEVFYLLPGDEMIYNKGTELAMVRHSEQGREMVAAGGAQSENSSVNRPDWYTFNSASLSEVFNQLSSYYGVEIYYYPDEVVNRFYSGRIEKTDSLENILKDIALLNHFALNKKNGSYFIQKKIN